MYFTAQFYFILHYILYIVFVLYHFQDESYMLLFHPCWNLLLYFDWTPDEIVCIKEISLTPKNPTTTKPCLLLLRNSPQLGMHSEFVEVKYVRTQGGRQLSLFFMSLPPALIFWWGWLGRDLWRILNSSELWKMETFWLSGIWICSVVRKIRRKTWGKNVQYGMVYSIAHLSGFVCV